MLHRLLADDGFQIAIDRVGRVVVQYAGHRSITGEGQRNSDEQGADDNERKGAAAHLRVRLSDG